MSKETIKLGFISGLSGVYGWMAQDQLRGATLALEEINKEGGIAGRLVEIIVKDDESKPELSTKGTRELIQKYKADFIIGSLSAGTHLFINKETKRAKKIFMSVGQSSEITMDPHLGPHTFHEAWTPYMSAQGMGKWVFENLGTKWFFLLADYEWGWHVYEAYQELAKRMGAKILGSVKIPFPSKYEKDFSKHFPNIVRKKPEVLIACNYGSDQLKFITAANKAGLKRKMSIVNTISELPIVERIDPEEAAGMYWGGNFYWALAETLPLAKVFVSEYRKRFHKIPSGYSAYGYSGGLELLGAAKRTGKYPIDSDAIAQELEGQTYAHYKTGQWWRPCDHQSFHDFYVLKLKGPEERKNKHDVSEVVGSTSWELNFGRTCASIGHSKKMWGHFQ